MLIYLFMLESDEEKHLFKELYERYGNAMLRVAQRYFPSDLTAAEDAVQNAWLKVIKNFSKIQEDSSNKRGAYLVTIVKNESISLLRKQRQDISLDEMLVAEQENTTEDSKSSIIAANIAAATAVVIMVYNILAHGENLARQTDFSTKTVRMQTVVEKQRRKAA